MDSFFFNITHRSYKIFFLFQKNNSYIKRVDISNGIVFFDIFLEDQNEQSFNIKNLDRMVMIPTIIDGNLNIFDNIDKSNYNLKKDDIAIFCSSKQDIEFKIKKSKRIKIFILFIADFFLKRYLLNKNDEPIDYLYQNIQKHNPLMMVYTLPVDALSLYTIDKITQKNRSNKMSSIRCEHNAIEFMIYRFSLLDFYDKNINSEELIIAQKAKQYLLKNYLNSPTIQELAHICATNESKLKKIFKQVYNITVHNYIQKLKLEKANILLKDQVLNIGQIASKVGYKHQGYFSKIFFDTYGVYPKDLLK